MTHVANVLNDTSAVRISAGGTEAVFLPAHGMLGISLRHENIEVLRRIDNLIVAAASNQTAGIPFLFPFANRLADFQYEVAGRGVTLSPHSLSLRYDENGLPMHGLMWPHLKWSIVKTETDTLVARLDWTAPNELAIFPYPCQITMTARVETGQLRIETDLTATGDIDVPVSFGFHPYFGLPGSRQNWRVTLPKLQHLSLDARKIPTGAKTPFEGLDAPLGARDFDDGYVLLGDGATLSATAEGQRVSLAIGEGYTHCQIFAPRDKDFIALEPMTAPTNALISGDGLRLVKPGNTFSAKFQITAD